MCPVHNMFEHCTTSCDRSSTTQHTPASLHSQHTCNCVPVLQVLHLLVSGTRCVELSNNPMDAFNATVVSLARETLTHRLYLIGLLAVASGSWTKTPSWYDQTALRAVAGAASHIPCLQAPAGHLVQLQSGSGTLPSCTNCHLPLPHLPALRSWNTTVHNLCSLLFLTWS